jgi:hypothetical protein
MKKSVKKLALNKNVLRNLGAELATVRGGGDAVEGLTSVIKDLVPFTERCPARTAFCPTAP